MNLKTSMPITSTSTAINLNNMANEYRTNTSSRSRKYTPNPRFWRSDIESAKPSWKPTSNHPNHNMNRTPNRTNLEGIKKPNRTDTKSNCSPTSLIHNPQITSSAGQMPTKNNPITKRKFQTEVSEMDKTPHTDTIATKTIDEPKLKKKKKDPLESKFSLHIKTLDEILQEKSQPPQTEQPNSIDCPSSSLSFDEKSNDSKSNFDVVTQPVSIDTRDHIEYLVNDTLAILKGEDPKSPTIEISIHETNSQKSENPKPLTDSPLFPPPSISSPPKENTYEELIMPSQIKIERTNDFKSSHTQLFSSVDTVIKELKEIGIDLDEIDENEIESQDDEIELLLKL